MIKQFLWLEWKAFSRSASFAKNLALRILMIFGVIYFCVFFAALGVLAFFGLKDHFPDPLLIINKFLIYYFIVDLIFRLLLQKIPVLNIRPLLVLPIKDATIVNFSLGKTMFSFFNWIHAFFFIPFSITLIVNGYSPLQVICYNIAIICFFYINNFLNILLTNQDKLFSVFIGIVIILGLTQYYNLFDITVYTGPFFQEMYNSSYLFLLPLIVLLLLYKITFNYFKKNLFLDAGLSVKHAVAKTENFTWLDRFGAIGSFIKNDIRMIKRNKRSKTTIFMSVLFLFYGLLFFTGAIEAYDNSGMKMFAAVFVSGGFLITFGQFVPSWDSAYYPLMMTQNIPYKQYLEAKWSMMVLATIVTAIIASFYLYFGVHIYLMILVGAIYNIGINSLLVLLGGAFTKTPIDLASTKGAFGDKKAYNVKTLLISIPQLVVPMIIYWLGSKLLDQNMALAIIAVVGLCGLAFKNAAFNAIEKIYKNEKYSTLEAYKQKS